MSNVRRHREIVYDDMFSNDTIRVMLVGELASWLYEAEAVEAALGALSQDPMNPALRSAFGDAIDSLSSIVTGWIDIHAPEKAPDDDLPNRMRQIKKLFRQVDFLLMPDTTLEADQAVSGVKARVRVHAEKISAALDQYADIVRSMIHR